MDSQEMRAKLFAIRDELLELNEEWMELHDAGELPESGVGDVYELYNEVHEVARRVPYRGVFVGM